MDAKILRPYRTALLLTAALLAALAAWAAMPSSGDAASAKAATSASGGTPIAAAASTSSPATTATCTTTASLGGVKVGDNATTAHNAGNPDDPSGLVDVLAYKNTDFRGPALCVPVGTTIINLKVKGLPGDRDKGDSKATNEPDGTWNDDISSFRWVANC